jgi:hypothetical protein
MSDDRNTTTDFTTIEEFNKIFENVSTDAYSEFVKLSQFFSKVIKVNGPDTFSTTLVTFNKLRQLVGVVTSREVDGKPDMYKALAQMLYFPMSLSSELFIVAQDARVKTIAKDNQPETKTDALIVTYVTPSSCGIFSVPYSIASDNEVVWDFDKSFITSVSDRDNSQSSPVGDMVELFYTFSHAESNGPFSPHEVVSFLKSNGFEVEMINPQNVDQHYIAIPFAMS